MVFCGLDVWRKNISTGLAQSAVSVLFTRTSKVELALFERVEVGEGGVEEVRCQAHGGLDVGVLHLCTAVGKEGPSNLRKTRGSDCATR